MAEQRDALTELVQQHVGRGKRWSTREFAARAIDPSSQWAPSKSLVGKIVAGQGYDITPELVGAIAVGLGLPREIIAAAAHLQLIGYEEAELAAGAPAVVLRKLGAASGEPERATANRLAHGNT
jgi:hypothetical protein